MAGITPKAFGATTCTIRALLGDRHRRTDGGIFKKPNRHLSWQTNTTMRCGKGGNVALMHRVTASEKHRIRHSGAIEMRTFRLVILSRIDIGPNDVPGAVQDRKSTRLKYIH